MDCIIITELLDRIFGIRRIDMKNDIHPDYHKVTVECVCGQSFETGTTKKGDNLKIEICNKCHPFFTGTQKLVDTGGRVERFNKRYGNK